MQSLTEEIWMEIPSRRGIVSLHAEIERLVEKSGVQEGIVLVNAMHITASVFINDNESGLHADYERWLESVVPFNAGTEPTTGGYLHNRTGEDNADAHHKRQIRGREVVVAITEGKLHLGPWEHIFYYEFDGRRKKNFRGVIFDHYFFPSDSPVSRIARNAFCGISTLPIDFIRFLPSFCFAQSFRFREISPP